MHKGRLKYALGAAFTLLTAQGCPSLLGPKASVNLPLLTPIVKAAAPQVFGGTAVQSITGASGSLSVTDLSSHFFSGSGPSEVYTLLGDVDTRIQDINTQSHTSASCLSQTPVAYTITPWGQSIAMYGQCYSSVSLPSGTTAASNPFVQWGSKSGTIYLWAQVGAGDLAAIVTPLSTASAGATTASASADYAVHLWTTVGNAGANNTNGTTAANWDSVGSYGVMEIQADPQTRALEMVAAGIGMGYCGVHFRSDGHDVYAEGAVDDSMSDAACDLAEPACVQASSGGSAVSTDSCSVSATDFTLTSIGRRAATSPDPSSIIQRLTGATWPGSTYPVSGPNVTLDGTSGDSLSFGPTTPTAGVGQLR
ncbi:MAG: hypothetical protein KGR26_10040 [Cyanobacteria bacterium REEB65]|nr:hypothetical protein [Cyanobacteria bacterium REEB65]